ncbi:hypothetical protein VIGAN_01158600 [Vigna angularis var. angularis]|uniref:Uncharacterized protein n=1 Tax=Vigna angularis var. angularis TaxID=157739 RepID=A0A0S3R0H4_PHAAN|nr:hypothetical protein VIGAN_01158600 [Vigna angularis var. angularis]
MLISVCLKIKDTRMLTSVQLCLHHYWTSDHFTNKIIKLANSLLHYFNNFYAQYIFSLFLSRIPCLTYQRYGNLKFMYSSKLSTCRILNYTRSIGFVPLLLKGMFVLVFFIDKRTLL